MGEPKGLLVVPIGFGPTDLLRSLELDASDNLKVAFAAAAQGLVGTHGWIGGAWQKNPLLFGYTSDLFQEVSNTNLPAGTSFINAATVPAGEIWVFTNIAHRYDGTPPAQILTSKHIDAIPADAVVFQTLLPVSTQYYDRQGWWVLSEGWYLRSAIVGGTLGDDAYLRAWGFKVDIDQ